MWDDLLVADPTVSKRWRQWREPNQRRSPAGLILYCPTCNWWPGWAQCSWVLLSALTLLFSWQEQQWSNSPKGSVSEEVEEERHGATGYSRFTWKTNVETQCVCVMLVPLPLLAGVLLWPPFVCEQDDSKSCEICGILWTREEMIKFWNLGARIMVVLQRVQ